MRPPIVGLHATVYCDCFERGVTLTPPPQPELVYVDENGQLSLIWEADGADQFAFFAWLEACCEHLEGKLVFHWLRNIALIAFLRERLSERASEYPVLLEKVLYSGTHGGDYLCPEDVDRVAVEIDRLKEVHCPERESEELIRNFEQQMFDLVAAAQRVRKPISF